ncbi:hypothetical protein IB238_22880 [Rhizobium sp. ARZ01]|uniref:hypothetical protein n=1 Tax=Rhizobium sp. ARZ01 TaxID=2769313 RepID=UPI001783D5D8|nr:hypothetical protein [Rhizobium sp. ARZ01]MBD9375465.1 hypothetical protein [Rhizobium sp. ARZ01]
MTALVFQQYFAMTDTRMQRAVLNQAGFEVSSSEGDQKARRDTARFLIRQFQAGTAGHTFLLYNLEHRPRQAPIHKNAISF